MAAAHKLRKQVLHQLKNMNNTESGTNRPTPKRTIRRLCKMSTK